MRATDVVLAELLNRRPPAAWLAASHDGSGDGQAGELIQLVRVVGGMVAPTAARRTVAPTTVPPSVAALTLGTHPDPPQALDCVTLDTVLVARGSTFDLVFVPRPAAVQDGVAFAVFATRVSAAVGVKAGEVAAQHAKVCQGVMVDQRSPRLQRQDSSRCHHTRLLCVPSPRRLRPPPQPPCCR